VGGTSLGHGVALDSVDGDVDGGDGLHDVKKKLDAGVSHGTS
jgi:hypothetical protein